MPNALALFPPLWYVCCNYLHWHQRAGIPFYCYYLYYYFITLLLDIELL
jgi:hypothetical protein